MARLARLLAPTLLTLAVLLAPVAVQPAQSQPVQGASAELLYLALGDSVPSGTDLPDGVGFPRRLGQVLAEAGTRRDDREDVPAIVHVPGSAAESARVRGEEVERSEELKGQRGTPSSPGEGGERFHGGEAGPALLQAGNGLGVLPPRAPERGGHLARRRPTSHVPRLHRRARR